MSFNNGKERKKFEMNFAKKRIEYKNAGMSESDIDEIYQFDLDVFNKNRTYVTRNQSLLPKCFDSVDSAPDKSTLANKGISYEQDFVSELPCGWVEEIENPELAKNAKKLSADDLRLISFVLDGYSQCEIAEIRGVSQASISKRINKIKNILMNF